MNEPHFLNPAAEQHARITDQIIKDYEAGRIDLDEAGKRMAAHLDGKKPPFDEGFYDEYASKMLALQ